MAVNHKVYLPKAQLALSSFLSPMTTIIYIKYILNPSVFTEVIDVSRREFHSFIQSDFKPEESPSAAMKKENSFSTLKHAVASLRKLHLPTVYG